MALKVIKDNQIIFFDEIHAYLPCSLSTLYKHGLHNSEDIKDAIREIRVTKKSRLRSRWYESENATLQISVYKLMASEEELRRLSVTKSEVSGNEGKPIEVEQKLDLSKLSYDELEQLEKIVSKLEGNTEDENQG